MSAGGMPWVKLWIDTLDDPKLAEVDDVHKWRFVQLILLAGQCDHDGLLVDGDTILSDRYIARRLGTSPQDLAKSLRALIDQRLVARDGDGILSVPNFPKRQGRRQGELREAWRVRQAKRRAIQQDSDDSDAEEPENVTRDSRVTDANVTPPEAEAETEADTEADTEAERSGACAPARPSDASPSPSVVPEPEPQPKAKPAHKQTDNYRPIFGWLQSVCQVNAPARVGKAAKAIDDSGATLEACRHFGQWWVACDWRGQKGQPPTPEQVWTEWPKALAWDGRAPSTNGKRHTNDAAIREAMSDPRYIAEEAKRSGKLS